MSDGKKSAQRKKPAVLFNRVASILEQARGNVVRAVNTNMVLAYWLIGREIVNELQGGKGRALGFLMAMFREPIENEIKRVLQERF